MYISQFGDPIVDPLQQLASLQVKPVTTITTITSHVSDIQKLQELARKSDWSNLSDIVTVILAKPDLSISAATIITPLKTIQTQLQNSKFSDQIQKALDIVLILAQNEAAATADDRFQNEILLSNRIDKLNIAINNFSTTNTGVMAIWNKITGKEKTLYQPIQDEKDAIQKDINLTPLTVSGRNRLISQFSSVEKSASAAWNFVAGSTILFVGYVLFELLKTKGTTAVVQWSLNKAKEKAAAKAAKHAKKLHKKYFGKGKKKKP